LKKNLNLQFSFLGKIVKIKKTLKSEIFGLFQISGFFKTQEA